VAVSFLLLIQKAPDPIVALCTFPFFLGRPRKTCGRPFLRAPFELLALRGLQPFWGPCRSGRPSPPLFFRWTERFFCLAGAETIVHRSAVSSPLFLTHSGTLRMVSTKIVSALTHSICFPFFVPKRKVFLRRASCLSE